MLSGCSGLGQEFPNAKALRPFPRMRSGALAGLGPELPNANVG
jgi:hypothetical protein